MKLVSQSIRGLRVPEPTLMGGPKEMGEGNRTMDILFVINRNFLKKNISKIKKCSRTKCLLFFYFPYTVQISAESVRNALRHSNVVTLS